MSLSPQPILVYPMPLDNEEVTRTFLPFAHRFAETYLKYDPGDDHELIVVCNKSDPTPSVRAIFDRCNAFYDRYDGDGFDLGSQQMIAKKNRECFQVNFTSRSYFHRHGWLDRLLSGFYIYGDGLYGMSASREGGNLHVCTRGHCYLTETFRNYPHEITSRNQGVFFELAPGTSLTDWYAQLKKPRKIVHMDCMVDLEKFDNVCNRFRDGDQSQMLCLDRHTDYYRDADVDERNRLGAMCLGI